MLSEKASGGAGRETAEKRPDAGDVCAKIEAGDMAAAFELLVGLSLEDLAAFLLISPPQSKMAAADFLRISIPELQRLQDKRQGYVTARTRAFELLRAGIRQLEAQRSMPDAIQTVLAAVRGETFELGRDVV
ncbi:MAG: hypothetical protein WC840_02320 [Candidatus Peribacteraceae bacterium]